MNNNNLHALSRVHALASHKKIVLGSGSPRRVKLLGETGVKFEQIIPQIDETIQSDELPYQFAKRMAEEKALFVSLKTDAIVIGCDTIVVFQETVLGKPATKEIACQILSTLSGQQHIVCTALAMAIEGKSLISGYELTKVKFREVSDQQIKEYVETGEPMDKAGAYGIQGMGGFLVDRVDGNRDNVVGFPRHLLDDLAGKVLNSELR